MNTETKYVRITSANSSQAWYAKMIGNVYPLGVSKDYYNHRIELGTCAACYISKSDCEEITIAPQTRQADYTITEAQIEELYGMGKEGYSESISDKLEEWFPEVFKPTPTYKVGDRFKREGIDKEYTLIQTGKSCISMLIENAILEYDIYEVNDLHNITDAELRDFLEESYSEFTRIE